MKKLLVKIAVLSTVLLGLITLHWWKTRQKERDEAAETERRKIVAFDFAKADRLLVKGEKNVVLERRKKGAGGAHDDEFAAGDAEAAVPSEWLITQPYRDLADRNLVTALTESVASLESVKVVDEKGANAAAYGLDKPSFEIQVFADGKAEPALGVKIGNVNSSGSYYYAQTTVDPRVVLVEKNIEYNARKDVLEWRDKKILQYKNLAAVNRVLVEYASKGTFEFVRDGERWTMKKPRALPAEESVVEGLLRAINASVQKAVASEDRRRDAAKFGLDRPAIRITTEEKDGATDVRKVFWLGKVDVQRGSAFVAREGVSRVYEVTPALRDDLTRTLAQFAAKKVFTAKEEDLKKVAIRRGAETTELAKKDGHWVRATEVQNAAAKAFAGMHKVRNLQALDFIGEKYAGFGAPSIVITLDAPAGPEELRLFQPKPDENFIGYVPATKLYYRFLKQDVDMIVHDLDVLLGLKEPLPPMEEQAGHDGHDHGGEHAHD